jgi:hypothetical protein
MRKLALMLLLLCAILVSWACLDSSPVEPGGTAEDTKLAYSNPDEYAWKLFFFLNRPAQSGRAGIADKSKKFGDFSPETPLVWETWALASGGDTSEVFLPNGTKPTWEGLVRAQKPRTLILSPNLERRMIEVLQEKLSAPHKVVNQGGHSGRPEPHERDDRSDATKDEEARMNHEAFRSIVEDQPMYNADDLESLFEKAKRLQDRDLIKIRQAAKEVKAEWLPLTDESQKLRYIWREGPGTDGKATRPYGLVGLHIISRDLPNWFWATFIHEDCVTGKDLCMGIHETCGIEPHDSTTHGPHGIGSHGSNGVRNETRDTIWSNYILQGTQTDFVKPTGEGWVLANPAIEPVSSSSCISCHAYASVGKRIPNREHVNSPEGYIKSGPPVSTTFGVNADPEQPAEIVYLQTSFMWTPVKLANRKKTPLP